jgi:hypothetical protein
MRLEDVAPAGSFPACTCLLLRTNLRAHARTATHNIAARIDTNRPVKPTKTHTGSA